MSCDLSTLDGRWLCAQVRYGSEFTVALSLKERGYESFVPWFEQKRRWSDRVKTIQLPLFTGYVFFQFNAGSPPAITTPGVLRLVGTGRMPTPVDESEIDALRLSTQAGLPCEQCAFCEVGQEVEVRLGPLSSLRGKVVRVKNEQRLVLSVSLIRRSVLVEVDGYDVIPVVTAAAVGDLTTTQGRRGNGSVRVVS